MQNNIPNKLKNLAQKIVTKTFKGSKLMSLLSVALLLGACSNFKTTEEGALARVYDQALYPSDIEGLVGTERQSDDSIMIVKAYIERWARDQMMLKLAEKNLPDDLNIDRLVENYRSELMLNSYTEALLKKPAEADISLGEIREYYDANKENYPLQEGIIRGIYIRVERDAKNVSKVKSWWKYDKDEGVEKIKPYLEKYAEEFILNDSIWTPLKSIEEKLPSGALRKINLRSSKAQIYLKDKNFRYYLIVKEAKLKNDPSPFEYVKDDIAQILLRKKRIEELEKLTEDAYKREIEKQNIEIF